MALIDQARQIDVATASINRFVRSLSSSNFAAKMELARSGFRNVGAWAARHERLELESKIARARDVVKKSDELFHADRVMALHPGKFQSSDQVKSYEMAMLKIRNPGLYKRRILEESVGVGGARDVLSEQARAEYDRALLEETDPVAALRRDLAERFGAHGGYARADRLLNIRRQEIARKDSLTDYQREREELTERYLGDQNLADAEMNRRADRRHRLAESRASIRRKAERIDLAKRYPAFKRFFLDSRNSTKDIHAMAGYLKGMSKIPVVGEILTENPIVAGSLAAYGALLWGMGKSDAANKSVIAWSNARNIYGSGSSAFQRAAYMAGVEDPGAISRRLGKQAIRYGGTANAESVYREFGSIMSGMTRDEKMYFAESIGFDDTDVAIAEMLAGGMKPSLARKVGANKAMLEAQNMAGFASGAGAGATAESLWLSIPGMVSAKARDLEGWASTDKGRKAAMDSYVSTISAAIGDDAYSANTSQPGTLTPSVSGGTSVSVHGNIIIENADNAQDVAEGIKNYVDKHTSRLRAATSQDPGAQ